MSDLIIEWINGTRLMQCWQLMPGELLQLCRGKIQGYVKETLYELEPGESDSLYGEGEYDYFEWTPYDEGQLEWVWFRVEDKIQFEKDHPEIIQPRSMPAQQPNGIVIDGSAPEYLQIAAKAWEALYKSGEYQNWKGKPVKQIEAWIKENYPHIDPTPATKIAQIINHNPRGGAPIT